MPAKLDAAEAERVMRASNAEPLVPYRGVDAPWLCRCMLCGREITPTLWNVRKGQGACKFCGRGGLGAEEAAEALRMSGFTPLEPYPGTHKHWLARCHTCGTEFGVLFSQVRRGKGCKFCARRAVLPAVAVQRIEDAGFTPLEPYPGASTPWLCRCNACGVEAPKTLHAISAGRGCAWCASRVPWTEEDVRRAYLTAGLDPIGPFPGPRRGWKSRCTRCDHTVSPHFESVRRGGGCRYCSRKAVVPEAAVALMLSQGYEPVEAYPGANHRWRCRCLVCGRESTPTFATVEHKRSRCKFCAPRGIDLTAPAIVYLITHHELGAHKVGIASLSGRRLTVHRQNGWQVYRTANVPTAELAREVEAAVLRWIRLDLGLPPHLTSELMPQRGETETVAADAIGLPEIWSRVQWEVANLDGA